jgi:hypothetical protein
MKVRVLIQRPARFRILPLPEGLEGDAKLWQGRGRTGSGSALRDSGFRPPRTKS